MVRVFIILPLASYAEGSPESLLFTRDVLTGSAIMALGMTCRPQRLPTNCLASVHSSFMDGSKHTRFRTDRIPPLTQYFSPRHIWVDLHFHGVTARGPHANTPVI